MNKSQLVTALAEDLGLTRKFSKEIIDSVCETVIKTVKRHGELRLNGFGTFKLSPRREREGVNPQKPSQRIKIPAMNVVTFKAGAKFKQEVKFN